MPLLVRVLNAVYLHVDILFIGSKTFDWLVPLSYPKLLPLELRISGKLSLVRNIERPARLQEQSPVKKIIVLVCFLCAMIKIIALPFKIYNKNIL